MKKLLSISVIAALAVLPVAAMADPVAYVTQTGAPATAAEASENNVASNSPQYVLAPSGDHDSNLATAGYVKGAYNASIKAINKVAVDAQSASQTLTNKTIDLDPEGGNNTITNMTTSSLAADTFVTSTEGLANATNASDSKIASEKAVRDAVDAVAQTMTDDFATKQGVTDTVTDSFRNAQVVAMATWGSDNTTNVAANLTFAQNDTSTAYHTPSNQPAQQQQSSGSGSEEPGSGEQSGGNGGGE